MLLTGINVQSPIQPFITKVIRCGLNVITVRRFDYCKPDKRNFSLLLKSIKARIKSYWLLLNALPVTAQQRKKPLSRRATR